MTCQFIDGLENEEDSSDELRSERDGEVLNSRITAVSPSPDLPYDEFNHGSLDINHPDIENSGLVQDSRNMMLRGNGDPDVFAANDTGESYGSEGTYFDQSQGAIIAHSNEHTDERLSNLATGLDRAHHHSTFRMHKTRSPTSSELFHNASPASRLALVAAQRSVQLVERSSSLPRSNSSFRSHITQSSSTISQQQRQLLLKYYIDSLSIWVRILNNSLAHPKDIWLTFV